MSHIIINSQKGFDSLKENEYTGVFAFDGKFGCFFDGLVVYHITLEIAIDALESFIEENS